jgi:hypothetical protein
LKLCLKHVQLAHVAALLTVFLFPVTFLFAQDSSTPAVSAPAADTSSQKPVSTELPDDRILGVLPNFLTVENPDLKVAPLTVKQKFILFEKETFDPGTAASAAAGAGISQIGDGNPKYGYGAGPYGQRFGAAWADIATQNFFSDAVMASVLHEDPRYFRRGPEFTLWYRVGYALSRVFVTRSDAGKEQFNYSGMIGMGMGIALSNAYYPASSVNGEEIASRFGTSTLASALTNLLPEFWPDVHEKFFHRKPRPPNPPAAAP